MDSAALYENGSLRVKPCRHGTFMYLANDLYVGRSLDLYGEFSEHEAMFLQQILRPGMVVIEAGANLGAHTVHMARAIGPGGTIHAFEPQRIVHQLLCGNLALNRIGNVRARQQALGAAEASAIVPQIDYEGPGNFGALSLGGWRRGETVAVVPLDALGLERCDFIKLDVEGMERAVLEGGEHTIARHRPLLYLENDRPDNSPALLGWLFGRAYRLYWHIPLLFNEGNFFGESQNVFALEGSINVLAVPEESSIRVSNLRQIAAPEEDWRNLVVAATT